MMQVMSLPSVMIVDFDQCRFGLKSPSGQLMKKKTRIMSNCPAIIHQFRDKLCQCPKGSHRSVSGNECGVRISSYAQHYPMAMCEAFAAGVMQTAGVLLSYKSAASGAEGQLKHKPPMMVVIVVMVVGRAGLVVLLVEQ